MRQLRASILEDYFFRILANGRVPYNAVHWRSRVRVKSYHELSLPNGFVLERKKPTVIIPAEGDDESILATCKKNTRNEIRKTYDISELHFSVADKHIDTHYELYVRSEQSGARTPRPKKEFTASECLLIGAYYKSQLVSGIAFQKQHGVLWVIAIYSLQTNDSSLRQLIGHSSRRIVFEAIREAKRLGFQYVDLAYVNSEDPDKVGITKFKTQFGGQVVKEYDYVYTSLLWKILLRFKLFL